MSEKKNKQFYVYTKAFSPSWNWDLKTREPFFFFFFKLQKKFFLFKRKKHTHKIVRTKFEHKNTPQITLKSHNNFLGRVGQKTPF